MAHALSLKIIRRKIRELQSAADKLERVEKPGIKQLRAVLKKFRLDPVDVQLALNTSRKSKLKGRKVKPKYRNPARRSETWTGRGRMPVWMADLVKKGKKPNDFLIKGA